MKRHQHVLAAKLALEAELLEPLAYCLSAYIETWARSDGRVTLWDITGHRGMIERVLLRHYARVISVMAGQVPTDDTSIDSVALGPRHAARLRDRAANQALHMMRGMDRDLAVALAEIDSVLPKSAAQPIETKDSAVSKFTMQMAGRFRATAKQAWTRLKNRLKAITNVETEAVAEEYQVEFVRQKHANSRIYKTWHNPMDGRERQWHHQAHLEYSEDGIPVDQPFVVGGEEMMQPGDTSRGASLANLINCFPGDVRVSGAVVAATRHWFDGEIVEVVTRGDHKISGTPNHPVLTAKGWVALGALNEGDDLVRAGLGGRLDGLGAAVVATALDRAQHVENIEPKIQQVFDALSVGGRAMRPVGLAVNFHGDVPAHDVDIVGADRVLWYGVDPSCVQRSHEFSLRFPDLGAGGALSDSLAMRLGRADTRPSAGRVGGAGQFFSGVGVGLGHAEDHALVIQQGAGNFPATDAELSSDSLHRPSSIEHLCDPVPDRGSSVASTASVETAERSCGSGLAHPIVDRGHGDAGALGNGQAATIEVDRVVSVRREAFAGHVFNLQTVHGIYHANGFVVHNCRCHAAYYILGPDGERIASHYQTPALPAPAHVAPRRSVRHRDARSAHRSDRNERAHARQCRARGRAHVRSYAAGTPRHGRGPCRRARCRPGHVLGRHGDQPHNRARYDAPRSRRPHTAFRRRNGGGNAPTLGEQSSSALMPF